MLKVIEDLRDELEVQLLAWILRFRGPEADFSQALWPLIVHDHVAVFAMILIDSDALIQAAVEHDLSRSQGDRQMDLMTILEALNISHRVGRNGERPRHWLEGRGREGLYETVGAANEEHRGRGRVANACHLLELLDGALGHPDPLQVVRLIFLEDWPWVVQQLDELLLRRRRLKPNLPDDLGRPAPFEACHDGLPVQVNEEITAILIADEQDLFVPSMP